MGLNNRLAKPGTRTYERWHKAVLDFYAGEIPQHGAIWLTYYPERDARVVSARARRSAR